jgi:SAM-dependent methyltransferase
MSAAPVTIHDSVREYYASRARNAGSCCAPGADDACCGDSLYPADLLTSVPSDIANFSLGCGNPITVAELQPGETVLDLGSGGGLDCFLAAQRVGAEGRVIGVDMTPEMLNRARAAAVRLGIPNVEFREGYLENLPVADDSVDVVISNCVINLSPDKPQVFREIFRVLKPGGRVAVSDIVTNGVLPPAVQKSMEAWGACIAGALEMNEYAAGLRAAGLVGVRVQPKSETDRALAALPIGVPFSATVIARKPEGSAVESAGDVEAGESFECAAPGGIASRQADIAALMSRIAAITPLAQGYEFQLTGDPAETRALAEAFIRAEAACCSFLRFELSDAPEGLRLRLMNGPSSN